MKRLFDLKVLLGALVVLVGLGAVIYSALTGDDDNKEHPYGEPDGEVSDGDVASFVD